MNSIAQRYLRLRSDPDAALLLQFSAVPARALLAPIMALQRELLVMSNEISEPEVLQAKLAWWLQELSACQQGQVATHPLTREIQQEQPNFAWEGWQRAVASQLQQASETGSANQRQLHDFRLQQGGAIWQAWLLAEQAETNPTLAAQGAMLQLLEVVRSERGRFNWIGLDSLARFQCRRSELQAAFTSSQSSPACQSVIRELAEQWLNECDGLLAVPAAHGQPAAAVLTMQLSLAQRWLRALHRKPLEVLRGHYRPALLGRLYAVWRAAAQHRRQYPD